MAKNKGKLLTFTAVILIAFLLCFFSTPLFKERLYDNLINTDSPIENTRTEEQRNRSDEDSNSNFVYPEPDNYSGIKHIAWLPDWANVSGFESLKTNKDLFYQISPVWFEVNPDGSLIDKRPANYAQIEAYCRENGIEVIPTIAMFDHELFSEVLRSQQNLDRHVKAILDIVEKENYDGIDLDYESTKLSDKEAFFEILEKLSVELRENERKFIFTVLPQWEANKGYQSLRETRKVQDWGRIGELVDEIRIMSYDYTSSRSINPGPIAPLDWLEEVIEYSIRRVPREKIFIGIHLYSYEWWMDADEYDKVSEDKNTLRFAESSTFNPPINNKSARSYTYITNKNILENFSGETSSYQGEIIHQYRKDNPQTGVIEERVLVMIDKQGLRARQDLVEKYKLGGVAYWRLGGDADLLER